MGQIESDLEKIYNWIETTIVPELQPADRIVVSFDRNDSARIKTVKHELTVFGNGLLSYRENYGQDWLFGENAGYANIFTAPTHAVEDLLTAWPAVKAKLLAEVETHFEV